MKDFRFINEAQNEAQKAKEAAAAKARELAEGASGKTDHLKAKVTDVKELITEQVASVSEMGLAKLNETLIDFNEALPALREAGYTLNGVNIEIGVPPKIVANFSGGGGAPDEKIEALLAKNVDRKLTVMLIRSVQQATKLQSNINIIGLKPLGLAIEIGLVPKVVVKFAPA